MSEPTVNIFSLLGLASREDSEALRLLLEYMTDSEARLVAQAALETLAAVASESLGREGAAQAFSRLAAQHAGSL